MNGRVHFHHRRDQLERRHPPLPGHATAAKAVLARCGETNPSCGSMGVSSSPTHISTTKASWNSMVGSALERHARPHGDAAAF